MSSGAYPKRRNRYETGPLTSIYILFFPLRGDVSGELLESQARGRV
jgi:hypothetical protein